MNFFENAYFEKFSENPNCEKTKIAVNLKPHFLECLLHVLSLTNVFVMRSRWPGGLIAWFLWPIVCIFFGVCEEKFTISILTDKNPQFGLVYKFMSIACCFVSFSRGFSDLLMVLLVQAQIQHRKMRKNTKLPLTSRTSLFCFCDGNHWILDAMAVLLTYYIICSLIVCMFSLFSPDEIWCS